MDDKIQNVLSDIINRNELSNLLIVGDSHMKILSLLFKRKKLYDINLSILKKKINFVTVNGSSFINIDKKRFRNYNYKSKKYIK